MVQLDKRLNKRLKNITQSMAAIAVATLPALMLSATSAQAASNSVLTPGTPTAIKNVQIDPATGAIVSPSGIGAAIVYRGTLCAGTDFCWQSGQVPYANHAYYGIGTSASSWLGQGSFYTGEYNASACWIYNGNKACSAELPPYYNASFGGAIVTSYSETIYSI